MTKRASDVHFRLMQTLPVRTHHGQFPRPSKEEHGERANRKAIEVKGRRYRSLTSAMKALHCSITKLYNMLDTGKAKYVEVRRG